jgi:hypothetical protein
MKKPIQTYRAKRMIVSAEILLNIGRGKFEIIAEQFPDDASVLSVNYDAETKLIELIITSESFAEVSSLENLEIVTAPVIEQI